jgi:hypothetical protein
MNIILPSRLTFWRSIFGLTGLLAFLALFQILRGAATLGVDLSVSAAWRGLALLLGLLGGSAFLLLILTASRFCERLLSFVEAPARAADRHNWIGILPALVALTGFTILSMLPFFQSFVGRLGWMRFLLFWVFSLLGMGGIKLLRRDTPWLTALLAVVLCQSTLHLLLV